MTEPKSTDPMVAALLRERDGYLRSGRPERAAVVTAELARRGYKVGDEDKPEPGDETNAAPRGRRPPGRRATANDQS